MTILITGGLGYIGSHICVELIKGGYDVIIVDNLINSRREVIEGIYAITGKKPKFYEFDIRQEMYLKDVFTTNTVDAVIHLASYKSVEESVKEPLKYYENNVGGMITLCKVMKEHNVKNIVFSSSATVYGDIPFPIDESQPKGDVKSPYGRNKSICEDILQDLYSSDAEWSVAILRYFNPIGAHGSALIGENSIETPRNIIPCITNVLKGNKPYFEIYGNDYPTHDGTAIRDYIHIEDLSLAHVAALERLRECNGVNIYNLGTGKGFSVKEILTVFERVCNVKIPSKIMPRRDGDVAKCICIPDKAKNELGWVAKKGLEDMCMDAWKWDLTL